MGTKGVGNSSYSHLTKNMPTYLDQVLVSEQYKDASNINARIQLHQRFSTNPYSWFRWVFDQFDLPFEANILEIGCGPGSIWMDNKDRIPAGWYVCLSDFSPGMISAWKVNLGSYRNAFTFEAFDSMAIPFVDETFDAIIANHMFYLVQDRQRALAEIGRVLKPDGRFYATTNGENHLKELSEIIAQNAQSSNNYLSPAMSAEGFTLENGLPQLAARFKQIEIHLYEDSLVVTEAEPLVAYIYSMITPSGNPDNDWFRSNLYRSISKLISQHSSIFIQKSPGIFIGVKRGFDDAQ